MNKKFFLYLIIFATDTVWASNVPISLQENKIYLSIKKQKQLEIKLKQSLILACQKIYGGQLLVDNITISYIQGSRLSSIPFASDIDDENIPNATIVRGDCQTQD